MKIYKNYINIYICENMIFKLNNIIKRHLMLLTLLSSHSIYVFSQNCSVHLNDAAGLDPAQSQLDAIENASCVLIDSFPEAFQDSFKVFDFGFYLHDGYAIGGYPEDFQIAIAQAAAISKYYLLFGKQTDKNGIYTKFWIALNLPKSAQFSCMSDLEREVFSRRVLDKTEEKYAELEASAFSYHEAEIAGIDELKQIIFEIKQCCIAGNKNRMLGCSGCSDELVNSYFELADFRTIDIINAESPFANINTPVIKDVSNYKFIDDGHLKYLGDHLLRYVSDVNKRINFNLLVTSNQSFCLNALDSLEIFSKQREFNCWINMGSVGVSKNSTTIVTHIKITWNQDKSTCINDPVLAERIIRDLYCLIYSELNVLTNECNPGMVAAPPPPEECNFDIPITTSTPGGGMTISEFIELVRAEESKYSIAEQEDTKTMITRFRKLFYGSPAWDNHLIPGAKNTPCIKPYDIENSENSRKYIHSIPPFEMADKGYFPVDPTTGERPAINLVTNPGSGAPQTQEVRLEAGTHASYLIDIGHTLCGMDAYNYPSPFTYKILGRQVTTLEVDRNIDAVGWLGDLSSAQAEIVVANINESAQNIPEQQNLINHYSSAPDMLGDIDGIVISINYLNAGSSLKKLSDILEHYYLGDGVALYQEKRYSFFSQNLGLAWDPVSEKFSNLEVKVDYYHDQTNDAAAYYVAGAAKDAGILDIPGGCFIASAISLNPFSRELLRCFFYKLEEMIQLEP
ncbi:MAG: hypothetical protein IPH12_14275 [Saprospirales bacterium]|nr:hypothetical protein [Saprospirales bacterium]MBK8924060.1 hypothetical protein [Saprospirales bacterium]